MSNIINVDFTRKVNPALENYLNSLREQGLDEDDAMDVVDAINDCVAFDQADEDIQVLASAWFG
jgi:hypothetical protein